MEFGHDRQKGTATRIRHESCRSLARSKVAPVFSGCVAFFSMQEYAYKRCDYVRPLMLPLIGQVMSVTTIIAYGITAGPYNRRFRPRRSNYVTVPR
ncbi:hypothetical protein BDZ89DRAFT_564250 [Hymenopellis radicata]|nr:hypothetical protein BDZ89DRAFT_564250 [Hymenopellis radicata]